MRSQPQRRRLGTFRCLRLRLAHSTRLPPLIAALPNPQTPSVHMPAAAATALLPAGGGLVAYRKRVLLAATAMQAPQLA